MQVEGEITAASKIARHRSSSRVALTPDTAMSPAASGLLAYLESGCSSTRRFQLVVLQA